MEHKNAKFYSIKIHKAINIESYILRNENILHIFHKMYAMNFVRDNCKLGK